MKKYRITSGSFRMPDNSLKTVGETIDLPDDLATIHGASIEEVTGQAAAPEASDSGATELGDAEH